jgi:hypothetical protein
MLADLAGVLICTSIIQHHVFVAPVNYGLPVHTKLLSQVSSMRVWWVEVDQVDGWVYVAAH